MLVDFIPFVGVQVAIFVEDLTTQIDCSFERYQKVYAIVDQRIGIEKRFWSKFRPKPFQNLKINDSYAGSRSV